jgi:hypothetical protein
LREPLTQLIPPEDGAPADPAAALALADEVLQQVSQVRGLRPLGPVARELHDEATLRGYITRRLEQEYPGDRLQREQRLLQALGLLPAECDLAAAVKDLYAAQTAGYYDPERRTLYISSALPAALQRPTMAHELTHALQDQHFKIGRYLDPSRRDMDDDTRAAIMGLLEGDATAVMLATLSRAGGGEWVQNLSFFEGGTLEALTAASAASVPAFLVQLLNFPYHYGTAFVASLYRSGGWEAVSAAYARPPRSTEQILHPERYSPDEDAPTPVPRAAFPERLGNLSFYYELVLGEFVTRQILEQQVSPEAAARAAAGWDGDRAALYAGKDDELLVWLSAWDSPADAAEFAEAARSGSGGGRVVEARGARVIHLRSRGSLAPDKLLEVAGGLWTGWK